MSDLDAALERVFDAVRAHLAAVRASDGRVDDEAVWRAYVDLNNASFAYDEALLDEFGEVTPWDISGAIDPDEADREFGVGLGGVDGDEPADPHESVVSVWQRRDYRVPSVAALLRVAVAARHAVPQPDDAGEASVETVGEAVLELVQAGDGSLGTLDIPELEPLDGVVAVSEVATPLDLGKVDDDTAAAFRLHPDDRVVGRLDETSSYEGEDDEEE